ncbi:MAG: T9SS type A sorting domain-containing protein [Bacteroidales bacterium]|nr:T9SS type A sorting domain-containing protein [Bacteroidales bacterium]
MKKIFTLVLILATVSSFAQSLMLSHEGNPLHHGDTVDVMVSQVYTTVDVYLDLTNVSAEDVTVRVYKNEIDMVSGATAALCFGGHCYPPATSESGTVLVAANSTLSHTTDSTDAFHFSYKTPAEGVSFVEFVFANEDNAEDNVSVTFKMTCAPATAVQVNATPKMRAYPNPATNHVTVEYACTGVTGNARLVIKNLMGATLFTKDLDVDGTKVKVDVSDYSPGIYFYSLEADGRPLLTKKMLVK